MENLVGCLKCINLSFLIHGLKNKGKERAISAQEIWICNFHKSNF